MGNPVVHFEIGCRDRDKTSEFYQKLFDWKIVPGEQAATINTDSDIGISGHITALGHEPHNYINFYVQVDDLAATLAEAEELGGTILIPPTEVPDAGAFAWMKDPEGNMIGLWKPLG